MDTNVIIEKMKAVVAKGNITKIVVKKDGNVIANFPVTVGVAGALLVPWVVIIGVVAALGYQCDIEFVDENGQVIDIDGKVKGLADKASDKFDNIDKYSDKVKGLADKASKEFDNIGEFADKAGETVMKYADQGQKKLDELLKKFNK